MSRAGPTTPTQTLTTKTSATTLPPKHRPQLDSIEEVDPALRQTWERLNIPLTEQKRLANVKPVSVNTLQQLENHCFARAERVSRSKWQCRV